jgi:hypothetical protein
MYLAPGMRHRQRCFLRLRDLNLRSCRVHDQVVSPFSYQGCRANLRIFIRASFNFSFKRLENTNTTFFSNLYLNSNSTHY